MAAIPARMESGKAFQCSKTRAKRTNWSGRAAKATGVVCIAFGALLFGYSALALASTVVDVSQSLRAGDGRGLSHPAGDLPQTSDSAARVRVALTHVHHGRDQRCASPDMPATHASTEAWTRSEVGRLRHNPMRRPVNGIAPPALGPPRRAGLARLGITPLILRHVDSWASGKSRRPSAWSDGPRSARRDMPNRRAQMKVWFHCENNVVPDAVPATELISSILLNPLLSCEARRQDGAGRSRGGCGSSRSSSRATTCTCFSSSAGRASCRRSEKR
jgi:hypothetical protein